MERPIAMSRRPTASRVTSTTISRSGSTMLPPAIKPPSRAPSPTDSQLGGAKKAASGNGEINIQVVVRCRGRSALEIQQASPIITQTSGPLSKAITIETAPPAVAPGLSFSAHSHVSRTYGFDRVFGPEADQNMVYKQVVEGMLDEVLAGYNCTIFAYGQTGTGKTYTMQGDVSLTPLSTPTSDAGIIPRVLHRLFTLLDASPSADYTVKCSYMEIYNEELRDLLAADYNSSRAATPLLLRDDNAKKGGGVVVQGLEEIGVKSTKEALALLIKGSTRRQTAETKMNSESSRSHSIFSLTVHVREQALRQGSEELLRIGKLNLVDLAGSEAISKSGAENQRAKEANSINKSLLMLGRVISALVEKASHIPYRDSKLTRILQDSLGGRTKTCIVATVSPTRSNLEETLSTLDYASRAKTIRNKPQINQHLTKSGVLKDYLGEIERLKADLLASRDKSGVFVAAESWDSMHAEHENRRSQLEDARQRADAVDLQLGTIKAEFETNMTTLLAREADLVEARREAEVLGGMVRVVREELEGVRERLEEERVVSEAFRAGEERLDAVAGGLRNAATESVKDVGGLFAKLARKAAVLGSNSTNAAEFAGGLQTLSGDLKRGLQSIRTVQADFGQVLRSEVQTFADEGKQLRRDGIASLIDTFSIFEENVKKLQISLDTASADSEASSGTITRLAEGLRDDCVAWAEAIENQSHAFAKEADGELREQSRMITEVFSSTTELVDAVISTAQTHVEAQAKANAHLNQLVQHTSQAEITRLKSQNELLLRLLNDERSKTVRMRTELVANVQNMLVAFTDAQDRSLRESLNEIQVANVEAETGLSDFARTYAGEAELCDERTVDIRRELELGAESAAKHRVAGAQATDDANLAVSRHIAGFAQETASSAAAFQNKAQETHQQLAESSTAAYHRAVAAFDAQKQALSTASAVMQTSQVASQERFKSTETAIQNMSSTVLASHATSSTKLDEQHAVCITRVAALDSATSAFLAAGILEDVTTGATPRKRVYNVPEAWERTKPREMLVESFRRRKAGQAEGEMPVESVPSLSMSASSVSADSEGTPPNSAPLDATSLEDQQNVPPVTALGKNMLKKSVAKRSGKEERPAVTILGEGMASNVPVRRSRKV